MLWLSDELIADTISEVPYKPMSLQPGSTMFLEQVEKVNFSCFQKETWLMELVLQRVQKGR